MDDGHEEVRQAIAGELRLLSADVRTSRKLAGELLDPEFIEVGRSGLRWDRDTMLADLPAMIPGEPVEALDMRGVRLAPGLVHLTYATEVDGNRALRSSLWRRDTEGRWRMYYHQGTPAAAD